MPESTAVYTLPGPGDTDRLGAALAAAIASEKAGIAEKGLAMRLEGDLGAGKTSLVRALLRATGFEGPVKSPTFSLLETYPLFGLTLNHFDFYRFEDPEEFEDAGFRDAFGPGQVTATEWTAKAMPFVPDADIRVTLTAEGTGRRALVEALSPLGSAVLAHLPKDLTTHA